MPKLKKSDFDKQYRFRESRDHQGVARCQLCSYHQDGYCVHPERVRRVILSRPGFFGQERHNFSDKRVCDKVEIAIPEGIIVPELEPNHGIQLGALEHGDPRCPYIVARLIDDGRTEYFGREIRVTELEGREIANYPCELPECAKRLGLRPWPGDGYLTSQGFEDGYIPYPPKSLDDGEPGVQLGIHEIELKLYHENAFGRWTEEAAADAVRLVKRLIYPHYQYHPETKTYSSHPQIEWHHLEPTLRLLGWGEIADRISFEMAVKIEERVWCISCALADKEMYHENPKRIGHDPYCPVCDRALVDSLTHHNAMPE